MSGNPNGQAVIRLTFVIASLLCLIMAAVFYFVLNLPWFVALFMVVSAIVVPIWLYVTIRP